MKLYVEQPATEMRVSGPLADKAFEPVFKGLSWRRDVNKESRNGDAAPPMRRTIELSRSTGAAGFTRAKAAGSMRSFLIVRGANTKHLDAHR